MHGEDLAPQEFGQLYGVYRSNTQAIAGLREHHDASGRTDIHLFDQWCHLASVHDDSELEEALSARHPLAFDLDSYRLLIRHFARPGKGRHEIIEFTAHV